GPSECPATWHKSATESYRIYANRKALDGVLSPALKPAPSLEMADGMCSVEQFLDCVPQAFNGCLDLTVCNSMIMVDIVKRHRRFTCIGNEATTDLNMRMK